jgi:acetoin utilization protein AcuB
VSVYDCHVRDVMTSAPITVGPNTQLLDAALVLRSNSIRHLPVVEGLKLVGLISDRDIQRSAPSRLIPITEEGYNAVFEGNTVNRIMTREPVSISPDAVLAEAIVLMQQSRCGSLPVIEHDELVGILTRGDLLDALHRILTGKSVGRFVESS